jgi:hypothetical protein
MLARERKGDQVGHLCTSSPFWGGNDGGPTAEAVARRLHE